MNKHKTKLFKKVFDENADYKIEYDKDKEKKIHAFMSEDMFVPLMGEMWSKAKDKYSARHKVYMEFTEWMSMCCFLEYYNNGHVWVHKGETITSMEELYKIWIKQR